MKNRLRAELNRELKSIRISPVLKASILAGAAEGRFQEEKKRYPLGFLAAAAAVIVVTGLALGFVSLRADRIDRSSTALAPGNGEWVWVSDSDRLFHDEKACAGESAVRMELKQAKGEGRSACENCIGGTGDGIAVSAALMVHPTYTPVPEQPETEAVSGMVTPEPTGCVWMAKDGDCYHLDRNCPAMINPDDHMLMTVADGVPCPVCAAGFATPAPVELTPESTAETVWCTKNGTFYHSAEHCSGMQNAKLYARNTAQELGKQPCPKCIGSEVNTDAVFTPSPIPVAATPEPVPVTVWCTKNGTFYHSDEHCSGMRNAVGYVLNDVIKMGKAACPVCMVNGSSFDAAETPPVPATATAEPMTFDEEMMVWYAETGEFYHAEENCSGMKNAVMLAESAALEAGKWPCPKCLPGWLVWTVDDNYYHLDEHCSGMTDAHQTLAEIALALGQYPCPACVTEIESAAEGYYATKNGSFYHSVSDCSGMKNAGWFYTEQIAGLGKEPCPTCILRGGEAWQKRFNGVELLLEAKTMDNWQIVHMEYEPVVEWIRTPTHQSVDTSSPDVQEMLGVIGRNYMSEDQAEQFTALLEAGKISGFRCVTYDMGYFFDFDDDWRYQGSFYLQGACGNVRKMYLVSQLGKKAQETVPIYVYANEFVCCFDGDGKATILTEPIELENVNTADKGGSLRLELNGQYSEEYSHIVVAPQIRKEAAPEVYVSAAENVTLVDEGRAVFAVIDLEDTGDAEENLLRTKRVEETVEFTAGFESLCFVPGIAYEGRSNRCVFLLADGLPEGLTLQDVGVSYHVDVDIWFAASDGEYYHSTRSCTYRHTDQFMSAWTEEELEQRGKQPCPECVLES